MINVEITQWFVQAMTWGVYLWLGWCVVRAVEVVAIARLWRSGALDGLTDRWRGLHQRLVYLMSPESTLSATGAADSASASDAPRRPRLATRHDASQWLDRRLLAESHTSTPDDPVHRLPAPLAVLRNMWPHGASDGDALPLTRYLEKLDKGLVHEEELPGQALNLGLLGTVLGLAGAMSSLAGEKIEPAMILGMIQSLGFAFSTTAIGLVIALGFKSQVGSYRARLEQARQDIADLAHDALARLRGLPVVCQAASGVRERFSVAPNPAVRPLPKALPLEPAAAATALENDK